MPGIEPGIRRADYKSAYQSAQFRRPWRSAIRATGKADIATGLGFFSVHHEPDFASVTRDRDVHIECRTWIVLVIVADIGVIRRRASSE